jgi:hypothetical protein
MENGMTETKSGSGKTILWIVLGCAGASIVCVLVFVLFVGGIVGLTFGAIRSSDVYQSAMDQALSHPEVLEVLGEPVKPGFMITGSINVNGPEGEAEFGVPLRGSMQNGTLHVSAYKQSGQWIFEVLELELPGLPRRIDLLAR